MTTNPPTPHLEADLPPPAIDFYGWHIQLTADGRGIIVQLPDGKVMDLERIRVRSDKRGLEVGAR